MTSQNDIPADDAPETDDLETEAKQDALADMEIDMEMEAEAEADDDASAEPAPQDPEDRVAELEAEVAELKDKVLRAVAEAENTRRIAAREKADAGKYAATNFARDILRVADFLTMAMQSVSQEARDADPHLNNLCVGIDMTMKELLNAFEANGIKPIAAENQPFDHNLHEAVQQAENAEVPFNTVLQVLRGGFTIQDRLLRPAQVIVSTGGPKANGAQDNADPDTAEAALPEGGKQAYEPGEAEPGQTVDQET